MRGFDFFTSSVRHRQKGLLMQFVQVHRLMYVKLFLVETVHHVVLVLIVRLHFMFVLGDQGLASRQVVAVLASC